uniref:Uncharacterized protein n=1 Tax=Globodera rostochiensis TaxID=31243 RepID=A0A914H0X3_GLORO
MGAVGGGGGIKSINDQNKPEKTRMTQRFQTMVEPRTRHRVDGTKDGIEENAIAVKGEDTNGEVGAEGILGNARRILTSALALTAPLGVTAGVAGKEAGLHQKPALATPSFDGRLLAGGTIGNGQQPPPPRRPVTVGDTGQRPIAGGRWTL